MVAPWSYTLDDNERQLCILTAERRQAVNREAKRRNLRIDHKREALDEAAGIAGELVFGKFANLYVDYQALAGPAKADFLTPRGETIDIKSTWRKRGRLIVPAYKKRDPCDWYGLVIMDWTDIEECPTGRIIGGMHRADIIIPERQRPGFKGGFVADQEELMPPDEFIRLVVRPQGTTVH
jgi:hypothetical protein